MPVKRLNIWVAAAYLLLLCAGGINAAKAQIIYTIAGDGYLGNVGNNIPAVCAGTPFTSGICLDGKGNLYLTCSNSIRKIDLGTGIITTIAGSDTWGHTGDGGPALSATLEFPYDLCMDKNDNLYISEWTGHYIRKINTRTGIISTVAGTGAAGYSGDNGQASVAAINNPEGIFTDAAGNIYFADFGNSRIRKINAATGVISSVAGTGVPLYSGDGGPAVDAGVPFPNDVNIDAAGNIYFCEALSGKSCRIRKIDMATGIVTTIAGNNNNAYSGDGGAATAASLFDPDAVFVDKNGNVFIATYDDSRLRKVDAATGIISTIAGNGITAFTGDGGAAVNASLYFPKGICVDDNGDIYIADHTSGRIRKISNSFYIFPSLKVSLAITASATAICPGAPVSFSATLTNGGADPQYQWLVNGLAAGNGPAFTGNALNNGDVVSCALVSSNCNNYFTISSNTITIQYKTATKPAVTISASNTKVCTGQQVNFTAVTKDAGSNPFYQWQLNAVNTGNNNAVFGSSALVNGDKINCIVQSDPAFTCGVALPAYSDTIGMEVIAAQAAAVTVTTPSASICAGDAVTFNAVTTNAGNAPNYQWKINGLPAGDNSSQFTYTQFANNDAVTCQISGAGACLVSPVVSAALIMQVKTVPAISIAPADTIIAPGTQLQLHATVPVNGITEYSWLPAGAVTNSQTLAPLTAPLYENSFIVLTAKAANGCSATATAHIRIFSKLLMPGAFSPNGDGLNDVFRIPPNAALRLKKFSVYSRLGNTLFTTTDISKGWDGNKTPPGVYVYIISGTDDKGPVLLKGTVVLVR